MIVRIWHGYTTHENAPRYEDLLRSEVFKHIAGQNIPGFINIELLQRVAGEEVEFVTLMYFESVSAVKQFAGEDYEQAVVPEEARKLLKRFDERSQHFNVLHSLRPLGS